MELLQLSSENNLQQQNYAEMSSGKHWNFIGIFIGISLEVHGNFIGIPLEFSLVFPPSSF